MPDYLHVEIKLHIYVVLALKSRVWHVLNYIYVDLYFPDALVSEGDGMQVDFSPAKKLKKRPPCQSRPNPSQKDRKKTVVAKYAI